MRRWVVVFLCLWSVLMAEGAAAQDIVTSPRPQARPDVAVPSVRTEQPTPPGRAVAAEGGAIAGGIATSPRPRMRPQGEQPQMTAALPPQSVALAAVVPVLRPKPRPADLGRAAASVTAAAAPMPAPPAADRERRGGLFGGLFGRRERQETARPTPSGEGFVCGDPAIRGVELARIRSETRGCGVEAPVRVTMVDGVRLTTPATMDCPTAQALRTWVQRGVRPAFGRQEVVELRVAASYICRTRNNRRGAPISEHGRGKAIDISGFILADGRELSVSRDYNRQMRQAHRAACGIFGTTLGPGSDGYHEDHLHFDTASHRNGPYCR